MATIRIGGKPSNVDVQHNVSKQGLAAKKAAKRRKQIIYAAVAILIVVALVAATKGI